MSRRREGGGGWRGATIGAVWQKHTKTSVTLCSVVFGWTQTGAHTYTHTYMLYISIYMQRWYVYRYERVCGAACLY